MTTGEVAGLPSSYHHSHAALLPSRIPEDGINACKFAVLFFFGLVLLARLLRVTIFVPWLDDYRSFLSHYFLAKHNSDVRLAVQFMTHITSISCFHFLAVLSFMHVFTPI